MAINMNQAVEENIEPTMLLDVDEARTTPNKTIRSLSDSAPSLAPSPRFFEQGQTTQDDHAIALNPARTPSRIGAAWGGLVLQLPPRDVNAFNPPSRTIAQSPRSETRDPYGTPTTVLPRHSRGMDFSRAATHLHHSTVAERPSPESSPTITHKSLASRRTSSHSMALDSPRQNTGWNWNGNSNSNSDKGFFPRSVGSTVALTSDTSSSSSGDDMDVMEQDEPEDAMMTTPQVRKIMDATTMTPYAGMERPRALDWLPQQSPNPQAFTSLRRRKHAHSVGRRSRLTTPDPQPQNGRRESFAMSQVTKDHIMRSPMARRESRRESLSMGTHHLRLTSSNEGDEENGMFGPMTTPGVVRRPVVRRSNLLPKTKGFARIRAELQAESAPVENEVKREAEVVKQVHQNYKDHDWGSTSTAPPSPTATTKISREESSVSMSDVDVFSNPGVSGSKDEPKVDPDHRRSSNQKEFWPGLYNRMQTPPPAPPLGRGRSSSGVSMNEDAGMESPWMPARSTPPSSNFFALPAAAHNFIKPTVESVAPESATAPLPQRMPTHAEITQKVNNKRRRDEDFDIASIKRRAVSPGLSVQSSPVPGQSPLHGGGWWGGPPRMNKEASLPSVNVEERASSVAAPGHVTPVLGPKRTGLQGMTDTSDGMGKMSIE